MVFGFKAQVENLGGPMAGDHDGDGRGRRAQGQQPEHQRNLGLGHGVFSGFSAAVIRDECDHAMVRLILNCPNTGSLQIRVREGEAC